LGGKCQNVQYVEGMDNIPASSPVVKEFRFYPESKIVTVVFADDQTVDFTGPENFRLAAVAAHAASTSSTDVSLGDDNGNNLSFAVPQGTPHETFDA